MKSPHGVNCKYLCYLIRKHIVSFKIWIIMSLKTSIYCSSNNPSSIENAWHLPGHSNNNSFKKVFLKNIDKNVISRFVKTVTETKIWRIKFPVIRAARWFEMMTQFRCSRQINKTPMTVVLKVKLQADISFYLTSLKQMQYFFEIFLF